MVQGSGLRVQDSCQQSLPDPEPRALNPEPSSGFTLVEILIAIVLMAILASVVIPTLSNSASSQLRGAAVVLIGDLQYVQAHAINTGETLRVEFTGGNQYRATGPDRDGDGQRDILQHPLADSPAHHNKLKGYSEFVVDFDDPGPLHGVTIESALFGAQPTLEFGKYGDPTASGEIVLRSGGFRVRITVAPITGVVTAGELEAAP